MSFPRYPEYKDSGVEWLGLVPKHWQVKRIRHVAQLNPSKTEIKQLDPEMLVSFLPMEAVGDAGNLNLERETTIAEVQSGYTYFREGDVTYAKITPCFENGKGAHMRGLLNGIGFGSTELVAVRPDYSQTTSEYLNWIFRSPVFRRLAEASMYGAGGQKRVPDDFTRDFALGFPNIEEQVLISRFLSIETAKLDNLMAEQEKLIALLKEKRLAVIAHVVSKGFDPLTPMKDSEVEWLGRVPENWDVRRLSSISTKITNGYVGPTRDILLDEGVRYLQSLHIKKNEIRFNEPYFVSLQWSLDHQKSILQTGDVLIVQTGDIGQVAVVTEEFEGCNCHALIIVSPLRTVILGKWLSWVLNSEYGFHSLLSIQTGALHPHLNCGNVKELFIPVPPLEAQAKAVKYLATETSKFDELISTAQSAIDLLKERRTALISAAVTGQIDVRGLIKEEQEQAA